MLSIDRMTIRVPAGHEAGAEPLARLVADRLAHVEAPAGAHVAYLSVPPVTAGPPEAVASSVAAAIAAALEGGR